MTREEGHDYGEGEDGAKGLSRRPFRHPDPRSAPLPESRAQKRPEPSRVRAMSWMFAGGTSGGGGAY